MGSENQSCVNFSVFGIEANEFPLLYITHLLTCLPEFREHLTGYGLNPFYGNGQ